MKGEKTALPNQHTYTSLSRRRRVMGTDIDRFIACRHGGRQRKTGDVRASMYRFRRNAKSFGGTRYITNTHTHDTRYARIY